MEDIMNRSILEQPFEGKQIKSRRGAFGRTLSYVEGAEYIRRLNDAFDAEWSFEVVEHHVYDAEVVVVGKLHAAGVTKMAFGGSNVTTNTQTGEIVSLADDLKAAATDALKKAASLLGIGLDLYSEGTNRGSDNIASAVPSDLTGKGTNGRRNGYGIETRGDRVDAAHRNGRLTQRQLAAIWSIGRALGVNAEEVRRRSIEIFGVGPEQLSKPDASAFIGQLQEALGRNGNGART
jgi:hypothetical protein